MFSYDAESLIVDQELESVDDTSNDCGWIELRPQCEAGNKDAQIDRPYLTFKGKETNDL